MLHVIYYVTRYYHAMPKLSIPGNASGRSPDLFDGAGKFGPTYDCYGHIIADLVAGRACAHTCLKPDTCYRDWETVPLAPRGYVSLDTFARRLIFGFPCLPLNYSFP